MADIEKKEVIEEQKQPGIEVNQGNIGALTVQLLAAMNKQMTIMIELLKEIKEK